MYYPITCPHCDGFVMLTAKQLGGAVTCRTCGQLLEAPTAEQWQAWQDTSASEEVFADLEENAPRKTTPQRPPPLPGRAVASMQAESPQDVPESGKAGSDAAPIARSSTRAGRRRRRVPLGRVIVWSCGVAAVLVLIAAGLVMNWKYQRWKVDHLAELWDQADTAFRQTSFEEAQEGYADVRQQLDDWSQNEDPGYELAERMDDVVVAAMPIESAISAGSGSLDQPLARLQTTQSRLGEFQETHDHLIRQAPRKRDEDSAGLAFSPADRWQQVLDWLVERASWLAAQLQEQLAADQEPSESRLEQLETLVAFLKRQGCPIPTDVTAGVVSARREWDYRDLASRFRQAGDAAVTQLSEQQLVDARVCWEAVQERFPNRAAQQTWDAYQQRVRDAMLARLSSVADTMAQPNGGGDGSEQDGNPKQDGNPEGQGGLPGIVDATCPTVLSRRDYTALATHVGPADAATTDRLVFVRSEDRCYALDAATGRVRWVCRTGYDARWLPAFVRHPQGDLVVIPWDAAGQQAITVADASPLRARWTWRLPIERRLAGPPQQLGDSVYLVLEDGEVWQFHLLDGKPLHRLVLPEPVSGSLVLREDRTGGLLAGRDMAIYLLDLENRARVHEVLFPTRSPLTLSTHGVWVERFVVLFENQANDRCLITVFRKDEDRMRLVQQEVLAGRVWQAPSVAGAMLLAVTDRGDEAVFTLQESDPERPLQPLFHESGQEQTAAHLPYFLSHPRGYPEGPFVAARGSEVLRYSVDVLNSQSRRQREITWTHALPDGRSVPVQPLQEAGSGVVVAARRPGRQGVFVESLDIDGGQVLWSNRLGGAPDQCLVPPPSEGTNNQALVCVDSRELLKVHVQNGRWSTTALPEIQVNQTLDWSPRHDLVVWGESDPPRLECYQIAGSVASTIPLHTAIASPVAIPDEGIQYQIVGQSAVRTAPGVWAAFVDVERSVHLILVKGEGTRVQYVQLDHDRPSRGWLRPLWDGKRAILLAHPDGYVARIEVFVQNGVAYLKKVGDRKIEGGIFRSLALAGDRLVACTPGGRLLLYDTADLTLVDEHTLSAPPTTNVVSGRSTFVGLENGHVAAISADGLVRELPVCRGAPSGLSVDVAHQRIYVTDRHGAVHVLDDRGRVLATGMLTAPAALPPIVLDGMVLIPTTDGSLESLLPQSIPDNTLTAR